MKRVPLAAIIIAVLCALGIALHWAPSRDQTAQPLVTHDAVVTSSIASPAATIAPPQLSAPDEDGPAEAMKIADRPRVLAVTSAPAQLHAGADDPILQQSQEALRNYRLQLRQNPVGNNAEITRALSGKNARSLRFLAMDAKVSVKGELLDRWDQPLFFHQISAAITEVRSAGPDRVMWTPDDEVLR